MNRHAFDCLFWLSSRKRALYVSSFLASESYISNNQVLTDTF